MSTPRRQNNDHTLMDDIYRRLPSTLYRYARFTEPEHKGWIQDTITGHNLYFGSPSHFNDPFDCRIPLSFKASPLRMEQFWRNYLKQIFPGEPLRNYKKRHRELIHQSTTPAGRAQLSEQVYESSAKSGMVCLSESADSILMWSYYAEGHRGVCLEFCTTPECIHQAMQKRNSFFPLDVTYCHELPVADFYSSDTPTFIKTLFGVKSYAWRHEKEWRLVSPYYVGKMEIPKMMLSGIIYGIKTEEEDKTLIRQWCQQRSGGSLALKVIRQKVGSFDLEVVDVDHV